MKLILTLLFIVPLTLFGQIKKKTTTDFIKVIVLAKLKATLNDPNSYSGVSWSALREEHFKYSETPDYAMLQSQWVALLQPISKEESYITNENKKKGIEEFFDKKDWPVDSLIEKSRMKKATLEKKKDSIQTIQSERYKTYVGPFKNYYIEHTFRSRNSFNGLILVTYYFRFSKELKLLEFGNVDVL